MTNLDVASMGDGIAPVRDAVRSSPEGSSVARGSDAWGFPGLTYRQHLHGNLVGSESGRPGSSPFVGLLLAALVAAGCATGNPGPSVGGAAPSGTPAAQDVDLDGPGREATPGPWDEHAVTDPDLLFAAPDETVPGQTIEIYFPAGTERGLAFVLEERVGSGWVQRYLLLAPGTRAAGGPEPEPTWVPYGQQDGVGVDDVGIEGTQPDILVIPPDTRPGQYRICTQNPPQIAQNLCALITVRAPS